MTKNLKKADGSAAKVEETLEFFILEFNKNLRKINVSHTRTFQDTEDAEDTAAKAARPRPTGGNKKTGAPDVESSSAVKANNERNEKSTLGDLGILADLKDQMEATTKDEKKTEEGEG
jgi:small subunit ribosomal protein S1